MHVDAIETARMAIYLNAALAGFAVDKFWGDGTRFRKAATHEVLADDPLQWLATQKLCRGFRTRIRCRETAPQLPVWYQASHWVLKALTPDGEQAWRPSYRVQAGPGSADRLWLVTYSPDRRGDDAPCPWRDLDELADDLRSVLKQLIAVTRSHIPAWQDTFNGLLGKLDGVESEPLVPAVPPEVLTELPARVVDTVFSANVFRGMGNWGDNIYDHPDVEGLTASLFNLLAAGLARAVDSTTPTTIERPVG